VGFVTVYHDGRLLAMYVLLTLVLITGGAYLTLLPALAENCLGLDSAGYSVLLTTNGLGALIGSLTVGRLPTLSARRLTLVLGIFLMGIGLLALSEAARLASACACLLVVGAGFLLFLNSANSTIQLSIADDVRGRVMAIWVLIFGAGQPLGSYAAGRIASVIGTPRTMRIEGLACLAAAALALLLVLMPSTNGTAKSTYPELNTEN
jgi:predicted MFS family arabinose efflux permease